jgi:hypothetical protein
MAKRSDSDFVGNWDFIVENWDALLSTSRKTIVRSLRMGIPKKYRGEVWSLLLGAEKAKQTAPFSYLELLRKPCQFSKAIDGDISKTFSEDERGSMLDFQASLKNILVAYANSDEEVGYAYGMNFVASMFLFYQPEEAAFWSFYALLCCGSRPHRRFYLENSELDLIVELSAKLVCERLPVLRDVFASDANEFADVVRHWFTTCFISDDFEREMNTFIFDQFLAFGSPPLLSFGLTVMSLSIDAFHNEGWALFVKTVMDPGKSDIMHLRQKVNVEWGKQWITTAEFSAMLRDIIFSHKDPMVIVGDENGESPDPFGI